MYVRGGWLLLSVQSEGAAGATTSPIIPRTSVALIRTPSPQVRVLSARRHSFCLAACESEPRW